jgi:hypothetical protein
LLVNVRDGLVPDFSPHEDSAAVTVLVQIKSKLRVKLPYIKALSLGQVGRRFAIDFTTVGVLKEKKGVTMVWRALLWMGRNVIRSGNLQTSGLTVDFDIWDDPVKVCLEGLLIWIRVIYTVLARHTRQFDRLPGSTMRRV